LPSGTSTQALQTAAAGTMTLGPNLGFSTYLFSGAGRSIATDVSGNSYIVGELEDSNGSITSIFVTKLTPAGAVTWAYAYEGNYAHGVAVDGAGNIFMLVTLTSAGQSVLAKLDPSGAFATAAVYLPLDMLGLTLDAAGNAYVTGGDGSSPDSQALVFKLTPSLNPIYGVAFGGSSTESTLGIAADASGNAYVEGITNSSNLPGAQNTYNGGYDAFLAKIDPTGSSLLFTKYFGNSGFDGIGGLALDGSGNVYLAWASYVPYGGVPALLPGSVQAPVGGSDDVIVAKVSPSGATIFSGRFGGSGDEHVNGLAVDSSGAVAVVGYTLSADFPVTGNAAFGSYQYDDGYVLQLNPSGSAIAYASYLGGTSIEQITDIAFDASKNAIVTGDTYSSDFPVTDGSVPQGGMTAFATKFLQWSDTVAPTCAITSPTGGYVSGTVAITASASDNVGVAKVEFYVDGVLRGTDLYAPYSWSWDTTGAAQGPHALSCKAYDAAGNVGTSATVTVTVNNAPVCTLAWNKTTVPSGSSATLTLTTTGTIPAGTHVYLYGTKNGATDFNGYDEGFPPYSQGFLNTFSNAGTYRRWVVLLGYDGSTVCTSNIATTTFEAPKCTASFSKSVVAQGSSVVFSLSSVGDIPAGSISYLYGTKNGVTDEPGNAFSGPNFSYTITNTPGLAGSYVRWLVVKTSSGQKVCQSNNTSTTFQ